MRQYLTGWNRGQIRRQNKLREDLLHELGEIDKIAEIKEFSIEEWQHRYNLEAQIEMIYRMEEI